LSVTFDGSVDLSRGIESLGNDTLLSSTGSSLGFDPGEVRKALGTDFEKSFPVTVSVDLPGDASYDPLELRRGLTATYGTTSTLHAQAKAINVMAFVLLVSAGLLIIAAVVVAAAWKSGKYKGRHRKKIVGGGVRARDLLAQMEESRRTDSNEPESR
jgi:hypothetical protein